MKNNHQLREWYYEIVPLFIYISTILVIALLNI